MRSETYWEREEGGGQGGPGRDHLKFEFWTFDINGVFFTIAAAAAADRLSKTPAILLLLRHPVGAALPCPPSLGTGCTKWLISEHNQISQYVPLYGVSHSAVQLFDKDFEGCPAHSTNKTRHPKCYPI